MRDRPWRQARTRRPRPSPPRRAASTVSSRYSSAPAKPAMGAWVRAAGLRVRQRLPGAPDSSRRRDRGTMAVAMAGWYVRGCTARRRYPLLKRDPPHTYIAIVKEGMV